MISGWLDKEAYVEESFKFKIKIEFPSVFFVYL